MDKAADLTILHGEGQRPMQGETTYKKKEIYSRPRASGGKENHRLKMFETQRGKLVLVDLTTNNHHDLMRSQFALEETQCPRAL